MLLRSRHQRLLSPPGARLLAGPVLALVRRVRGERRPLSAELRLAPMIAVLSILVFYQLPTFSPALELLCACRSKEVPLARCGKELEQAPIIALDRDGVSLNGNPHGWNEDGHFDFRGLHDDLIVLRNNYRLLHPEESSFPGRVILEIDGQVPYAAISRVMAVCNAAGFPRMSFVVRRQIVW